MVRKALVLTVLLVFSAVLWAQPPTPPGQIHALVLLPDASPVPGAMVMVCGQFMHHPMQPPRPFRMALTGPDGVAFFPDLPPGPYEVTAEMRQMGFAATRVEVVSNQTTNVTLTVHHHDSTFRPPDSLTVVELAGTAIVVTDTLHPMRVAYFLDVDGDGTADFRLSFGPPWYNPPSQASRPANGDEITIVGGLLTHTTPPVVVVFEINGLFWRDPHRGHGGNGGGDHQGNGCDPDSVTVIELAGTALVDTCHRDPGHPGDHGPHGELICYAADTDADGHPNYALDFGRPDYNPGNGATRPLAGDEITIVGGQVFCPPAMMPMVIVYEINGLLWRTPGDTVGLGAIASAVDEPVYVGQPSSHLMARNYPNPFNPLTTISYSIPVAGDVQLKVFDITGREVATLVNSRQNAGSYAVAWDGSASASGIYLYRISVGNLSYAGRMVLMK
jgi:hypothetical protein